ncbi:MAG: hypothetical protein ACE37F_34995 [Nannocystaceae bacterium]|nr:hypothetical protein [bacterium]
MPLSLCMMLALAAPPVDAEDSAQVADPLHRGYQGPVSVRPEITGLETTSDAPTPAPLPASAARSSADGSLPPARFVDVQGYPPRASAPEPALAPPRTLVTIDGPLPSERASLGGDRVTFYPGVQIRTHMGAVSPFRVDAEGNELGEGFTLGGRVRWRPELGFGPGKSVRLVGMLDVANGRWAPATSPDPIARDIIDNGQPPIATGLDQGLGVVDPRELYLEWTSDYGVLRVGQQAFGWGLGLVANDGNNMDRFGDMKFGNDGDGSIVERLLFATKPLASTSSAARDLVVALGADLVYRDPNADLAEGDLAGQGIFVLRWEPRKSPGAYIGGYVAYRHQRSADDGDDIEGDDQLRVVVGDIAGRGYRCLTPKLALLGAFEGVIVGGRTTFARGEHASHRVLQGGLAARGFVGDPTGWLAGLDAGWFSGDANPDDDRQNGFEAAPGYTAGLLLFPYIRGWQSARSARRAEDPLLAGEPPNGVQYLPTEGRVGNVLFVQPKARWAIAERFELWGGPLLAASSAAMLDPLAARLAGGAPSNAFEAEVDSRFLATELDLGIRTHYGFRGVWLQAGVQGGVLFPGPAFDDPDGLRDDPTYGGWLRLEVRY